MVEISFLGGAREQEAVREIFFLSSSRQSFASSEEKETFFDNWTDYYAAHGVTLVAKDGENVLGYLMGCADSAAALSFYENRVRYYSLFKDLFPRFPAHLHINCHPDSRGKGVGRLLIERFVVEMRAAGACGVHLVTQPFVDNRHFYRKTGFTFETIREWKGNALLFMGRSIE